MSVFDDVLHEMLIMFYCASSSVGCPAPSEPVNGSVSGFTSASVGSEVTYHCDTGLTLVGERVAMCTSDLVWVVVGDRVSQCRSGQWTVLLQDVRCTADTSVLTPPGDQIMYLILCINF